VKLALPAILSNYRGILPSSHWHIAIKKESQRIISLARRQIVPAPRETEWIAILPQVYVIR
jgi:hypothetical protein